MRLFSIGLLLATGAACGFLPDDEGDRSEEGVCARWKEDRANLSEGEWTGNLPQCDAGALSADAKRNATRMVNLYRWMAKLPSVSRDPDLDAAAQECALVMDVNQSLDHDPPKSWDCWTKTAADSAGQSNLVLAPAVEGIDIFMADPGNEDGVGHRRWILSNHLGDIGIGGTSGASCLDTVGDYQFESTGPEWTAFPPPGFVPLEMFTLSWQSVSEVGWSIQSDEIDLTQADVNITREGEALKVNLVPITGGGSEFAINVRADGWEAVEGTYTVDVDAGDREFSYDVEVVDCDDVGDTGI